MMTTHLRSTNRPEFSRTRKGRFVVWTECGIQSDACLVDNEVAECRACLAASRLCPECAQPPHDGPCDGDDIEAKECDEEWRQIVAGVR